MEKQFCQCAAPPRRIADHCCFSCGGDKVSDCLSGLVIDNLLYSEQDIADAVKRLGLQISSDYAGKQPLVLLCVLKGAYIFTSDLSRALTIPHTVEFIRGSNCKGVISEEIAPPTGKHVIIVVDTGLTLKQIIEEVESINPLSIECCTLIQTPKNSNVKYIGMTLDHPELVVGYGFDEHLGRLPYIATASLRRQALE